MTITIDLPPEDERKLASRAAARGLDIAAYVHHLVRQDLDASPPRPNQASLRLLAQWAREDKTDDPAELERRRLEWEELKRNLNRNREDAGARKIFP